jgi:hypothetical protein
MAHRFVLEENVTPMAVGALSRSVYTPANSSAASEPSAASAQDQIPVWGYWEGPMPDASGQILGLPTQQVEPVENLACRASRENRIASRAGRPDGS